MHVALIGVPNCRMAFSFPSLCRTCTDGGLLGGRLKKRMEGKRENDEGDMRGRVAYLVLTIALSALNPSLSFA